MSLKDKGATGSRPPLVLLIPGLANAYAHRAATVTMTAVMHVNRSAPRLAVPAMTMPMTVVDDDDFLAPRMHVRVIMTMAALDDHRLRFCAADGGRGRERESSQGGGSDEQASHSLVSSSGVKRQRSATALVPKKLLNDRSVNAADASTTLPAIRRTGTCRIMNWLNSPSTLRQMEALAMIDFARVGCFGIVLRTGSAAIGDNRKPGKLAIWRRSGYDASVQGPFRAFEGFNWRNLCISHC